MLLLLHQAETFFSSRKIKPSVTVTHHPTYTLHHKVLHRNTRLRAQAVED